MCDFSNNGVSDQPAFKFQYTVHAYCTHMHTHIY